MYQHLRCVVLSNWKYQWLPAGAGEFGSARQSSARAVVVSAPTLTLHTRSVATSAIDPIGLGICPDMMPLHRPGDSPLTDSTKAPHCECTATFPRIVWFFKPVSAHYRGFWRFRRPERA